MDNQASLPTQPNTGEPSDTAPNPQLDVSVGNAMPPQPTANLPVLHPQVQAVAGGEGFESGPARSLLAEGLHFVGHAQLRGPCTIAGSFEGNLSQAPDAQISVVVTATGRVLGDITAQKISVMGHTDGLLDAGHGEVALHDTANVRGLVRYGRIQVNGAELNATLERATPASSGPKNP